MRVLILGGDGMLGHRLHRELAGRHEVGVTVRRPGLAASPPVEAFPDVDVRDFGRVEEAVATFRPRAIVNAVGVVKQRPEAEDPLPALEINSVFPHRLAALCLEKGIRLVHFSTDCVFSGARGSYRESDPPDPGDLYGRTKLLGELGAPHLTLRTSMIGLERGRRQGLVEWFLASRGTVRGYRRAIFSGLTTAELARLVDRLLVEHPGLAGLWHVASDPIDKHSLLSRLALALGRSDVRIEPRDEPVIDRSLCADALAGATGYRPPAWDKMIEELARTILERRE